MASIQEEDVLGKAYDSRLMKRLLGYLRPYRAQVLVALVAIILKAGVDVLGPYLTKVAIDKYLANRTVSHSWLDRYLSAQPLTGIAQIAAIYLGLLLASFLFEFTQTYIMQWAGQKVMFDLRAEIFRHLQRLHIAFYDRNPVGRLVTRVTSDVDALNEMFTAGVVSIFEDIFVLAGIVAIMLDMSWRLALITFAVLPIIAYATGLFRRAVRESYRRIRIAIAKINAYLQEHVTGIVVLQLFNREKRSYEQFEKINRTHMDAFKDAILAHAIYYPVVEVLSATAIACVVWFGGNQVIRNAVSLGVLVAFMQYAQRFFRPIQDLSEKYNILQSAMASSERVFKLLDTKVDIVSPAMPQVPLGPGRIEFDHVWFAYRTMAQAAEEAASKGEKIAASGSNGRIRLGAARRVVHHRPRRYSRIRRSHRRGQNHDHFSAIALLRRAEGRDSHRWRGHPRDGPGGIAATLRRGAARSVSVLRHRRRQHSAGHSRGLPTRPSKMLPSRSMSPTSSARCLEVSAKR